MLLLFIYHVFILLHQYFKDIRHIYYTLLMEKYSNTAYKVIYIYTFKIIYYIYIFSMLLTQIEYCIDVSYFIFNHFFFLCE